MKIFIELLAFLTSPLLMTNAQVVEGDVKSMIFFNDSTKVIEETVEMADSAYIQGNYPTAAAIYEGIISNGKVSPSIYMNLGSSYYKMDEIAKAILNYERAYLLDPSDEDVRFNLELARTHIVDKEVIVNELFIISWYKKLGASLSISQWTLCAIACFSMLFIAVAVFVLSRKVNIKKVFFSISLGLIFITIFSFSFAYSQKKRLLYSGSAIIMSPSVTVKSTPSENGTELFIIHEGRKVRVLDSTMNDWVEISLNDGNKGWVQNSSIEYI